MPRVNPQTRNVGNLGDVLKHAALLELASLLASRGPAVRYVETHTFLLHAPPADPERWRRDVHALAASRPTYARYAAPQEEALAGSGRQRCSSGLVIDALGERRGATTLAEAHAATRAELREQIAHERLSNVVVVDDAAAALDAQRGEEGGALLIHVDPFTLSPELWARLAPGLDDVCRRAADVAIVVYRYTRRAGDAWPDPPVGTAGPVTTMLRNPHEVAVYASSGLAELVRDAC